MTYWAHDEADKQREYNKSREVRRRTRQRLKREVYNEEN